MKKGICNRNSFRVQEFSLHFLLVINISESVNVQVFQPDSNY